jgi:hypothetical protein
MDLHGEIMNIPEPKDWHNVKGFSIYLDDPRSYRLGHRDARHSAAQLSLKYTTYIEALEDIARSVLCDSEEVFQELREECGID